MEGFERHIFANPHNPLMCPVLSLAIYWAVVQFDEKRLMLFDGDSQDNRYLKSLKLLLKTNAMVEMLKTNGYEPGDDICASCFHDLTFVFLQRKLVLTQAGSP